MTTADVDAAARAGVGHVNLSVPVSDRQIRAKLRVDRKDVLERIRRTVAYARDRGFVVSVGGEDASRAEPAFVDQVLLAAEEAGASRFRFADTVGVLEPFATHAIFRHLCAMTDLELEFHGHDDLGLATANTLAAVRELTALADLVALAAGRPIPEGKPIVGGAAFTHESGIHVSGLLRDPMTYEALSPEPFGRRRQLVLGKHSGGASVRHALACLGLHAEDGVVEKILQRVRLQAIATKKTVGEGDLVDLYVETSGSARAEAPVVQAGGR
jgi:homocitrate synthase NifV